MKAPSALIVYLDRAQCDYFNVAYFGDGKLVVAADTLLKSKGGDGYDAKAKKSLKAHEQDTLVLEHQDETMAPGWFVVTKVIPSFARPKEVRDAWKLANGIA